MGYAYEAQVSYPNSLGEQGITMSFGTKKNQR